MGLSSLLPALYLPPVSPDDDDDDGDDDDDAEDDDDELPSPLPR